MKNMPMPILSPRLRLAAELVRAGVPVADIGTDHAYLPAFLAVSGKSPRCVACDLRPGPLARAEETVRRFSCGNQVALRLSDGLDKVAEDEARDVVLAGMGGELILAIVLRCEWLRRPDVRLVLQPMTAQEELRCGLCENGFEILREAVACEGDKLYLALTAGYTGKRRTPDDVFCAAGLLAENGDALSAVFLKKKAAALQKRADGLRHARSPSAELPRAEQLAAAVARIAEQAENRLCLTSKEAAP